MLLSNKQSSLLNVQVLMALLTNLLHKSKYFISTKTFRLFIEQIMLGGDEKRSFEMCSIDSVVEINI